MQISFNFLHFWNHRLGTWTSRQSARASVAAGDTARGENAVFNRQLVSYSVGVP